MLMAFAVTQASRWASDEEDGLHELVLATPQSRLTVLLARFGALTTATVIIGVVTLVATAAAAAASGLALDGNNLAAASLSMIPLGLLIAALGYLFSGWLRTAIDTGLLSFLLVIWFVHHLHRAGTGLVGGRAEALGLLLLRPTAYKRLAGGEYGGRAAGGRRGPGAGLRTVYAQGYRALAPSSGGPPGSRSCRRCNTSSTL